MSRYGYPGCPRLGWRPHVDTRRLGCDSGAVSPLFHKPTIAAWTLALTVATQLKRHPLRTVAPGFDAATMAMIASIRGLEQNIVALGPAAELTIEQL
jgi:hypothetical protein